jgi:hypothetical protein
MTTINLVYQSPYYQVVEYPELNAFELVDNVRATGTLIHGDMATNLRSSLQNLFENESSQEEIEDVIGEYDALMIQSVSYH